MTSQCLLRRAMDGIHWNMFAHRRMTNIVLTHVSQAWGLGVPEHPVMVDMKLEFDPKGVLILFIVVLVHYIIMQCSLVHFPCLTLETC